MPLKAKIEKSNNKTTILPKKPQLFYFCPLNRYCALGSLCCNLRVVCMCASIKF